MRRMLPAVVSAAALAFVSTASGCAALGQGPRPDTVLADFAAQVKTGKPTDALFASPAVDAYDKVVASMGSDPVVSFDDVSVDGDEATARLTWHWSLPGSTWVYRTHAHLLKGAYGGSKDSWRIQFRPDLIEPSLKEGEALSETSEQPRRAEILGAGDTPLVSNRPVVRVGLDKTKLGPGALVPTANQLATTVGIKPKDYVALAKKMGASAFVPAIIYRKEEVPAAVAALAASKPAVLTIEDEMSLAPTKQFAAPLLGQVGAATAELIQKSGGRIAPGDLTGLAGLQRRYDEQLAGKDGATVQVTGPAGTRQLYSAEPEPGTALRTTIDLRLQTEADRLLSQVGPPSALVALQPSTGNLFAVANGPGTDGQNIATYGRYAPGSTFKIVTALALLRSGMDPNSTVDCPATTTVDGKQFKNYPDYPGNRIGRISLTQAIANSCNTAMITSRDAAAKAGLAKAAQSLGFGADHDTGFPAYFGQVPTPRSKTEAAADLIGQGKVSGSPMAMAAVIASVVKGSSVTPRLIEGHNETGGSSNAAPLTAEETSALRDMLGAVVTEGSGVSLKDLPGPRVIAKTGTAQYGDKAPYPTHAWMVAAQGDLAVAVFVGDGESGSGTAGPILKAFLRAANGSANG